MGVGERGGLSAPTQGSLSPAQPRRKGLQAAVPNEHGFSCLPLKIRVSTHKRHKTRHAPGEPCTL